MFTTNDIHVTTHGSGAGRTNKSDERAIDDVLARYVRATDRRDGAAQGALFSADAVVQIFFRAGADSYEAYGAPLIGGTGVQYAVEKFMAPHPEHGSSHHVTANHIVDVDGDEAHLNAQFIVFEVRQDARPQGGWPLGAVGARGTVACTESGYYDTSLRRVDGSWQITRHNVLNDLPPAFPAE